MGVYLDTEHYDEGSGLELAHISDVLDVLGKEFSRRAFNVNENLRSGLIQISKSFDLFYEVYIPHNRYTNLIF